MRCYLVARPMASGILKEDKKEKGTRNRSMT